MKYLSIIVILLATRLGAQTNLSFDKRFVQSEDRWVAFSPDKDSAHIYGFIYIDPHAGLTFNYEGTFKISPAGKLVPTKLDSTNFKVRLEPNNVMVAFIPENRFQELEIPTIPDWLQFYKTDTNSIERLYSWGYRYNSWGECAKALTYLERAQIMNAKHPGLAVELSYSYNCLEQYDKAEAILREEIKTNSTDAYVNKEYIYTLAKSNKIDEAVRRFEASLTSLKERKYDAENCYNILQYYYYQKDRANFSKWYKIFQSLPNENMRMKQYADNMKSNLEK